MRALRYYGPLDFRLENDVPRPTIKADEVLVKVKAAGICGTDLEIVDGEMPFFTQGLNHLPFIPGHEWSGVVVEAGDAVSGLGVGDPVVSEATVPCGQCSFCLTGMYTVCPTRSEIGVLRRDGGFAEFVACPAKAIHKIDDLSFTQGALVEPAAVATNGVVKAGVSPRTTVAVLGPGPIGLMAVQAARAFGAKRILLSGTRPERLTLGRKYGADMTVNVLDEDIAEAARELTDGRLFDVVIEATGNPSFLESLPRIVRIGGKVCLLGLFAGKKGVLDLDDLVFREINIFGALSSPNIWEDVIELFRRGKLTDDGMVTHVLPLERYLDAFEMVRTRSDGAIKVLLDPA